ncbi:MAG TPA: cation transporter [Gemmatimonadaceae bacterium]|nr:cation transporter [Gemmatimonadaceae bacterium]
MPPVTLATLAISGMRSVHCARAVWTTLAGVEGVLTADVVVGSAELEHDGRATREAIAAAIEMVGYELVEFTERRRQLPVL